MVYNGALESISQTYEGLLNWQVTNNSSSSAKSVIWISGWIFYAVCMQLDFSQNFS